VSGRDSPIAELVAINAFVHHQGIGSALLRSIVDGLEGFEVLRLTTTNDNLDALRFYQRRGFRLQALRPGAVDAARAYKPTISAVGEHGIPIRDDWI
jgi:GNAT superfamily N-acetyltransferase